MQPSRTSTEAVLVIGDKAYSVEKATYGDTFISGKVARPSLPAPTLERPPGLNREQRRAARKKKR